MNLLPGVDVGHFLDRRQRRECGHSLNMLPWPSATVIYIRVSNNRIDFSSKRSFLVGIGLASLCQDSTSAQQSALGQQMKRGYKTARCKERAQSRSLDSCIHNSTIRACDKKLSTLFFNRISVRKASVSFPEQGTMPAALAFSPPF